MDSVGTWGREKIKKLRAVENFFFCTSTLK
jgi:hypothetical protein